PPHSLPGVVRRLLEDHHVVLVPLVAVTVVILAQIAEVDAGSVEPGRTQVLAVPGVEAPAAQDLRDLLAELVDVVLPHLVSRAAEDDDRAAGPGERGRHGNRPGEVRLPPTGSASVADVLRVAVGIALLAGARGRQGRQVVRLELLRLEGVEHPALPAAVPYGHHGEPRRRRRRAPDRDRGAHCSAASSRYA